MLKAYQHVCLLFFPLVLSACAPPKKYDYTAFRQSRPRSILVLPPLNTSPDTRAVYSFLSTVTRPLAESGYYVFPVALVDQTFKENGLANPGEMHQAPLSKLGEVFGADAALFVTVEEYGTTYYIIDSTTVVAAKAKLVDIRNGELLWEGKATASSAETQGGASFDLISMLISAVIRQIISSVGDEGHSVSRLTSTRLLKASPNGLLHGPRSPLFETD